MLRKLGFLSRARRKRDRRGRRDKERTRGEPDLGGGTAQAGRERNVDEPGVYAFISVKGGCGKSTISANTAIIVSALYGTVYAVDADTLNSSLTKALFSVNLRLLKSPGIPSVLRYMVEPVSPGQPLGVELVMPPGVTYSIGLPGRPDEGVGAGRIIVLPARPFDRGEESRLRAYLLGLSEAEKRRNVHRLYSAIAAAARAFGAGRVIVDFPPLQEGRASKMGVFAMLESIPNIILVTPMDPVSLDGAISHITHNMPHIIRKIRAVIVNAAYNEPRIAEAVAAKAEKKLGVGMVEFIRFDPRWRVDLRVPPIVLGTADEGANGDLFRALSRIGIIDRSRVMEVFGFDPETVEPVVSFAGDTGRARRNYL